MPPALLQTALDAADAAAAVHARYLREPASLDAREKGRSDFVSEADLEAQRVALAMILDRFPDHQVLAEEDDGSPSIRAVSDADPTRPLWVVDPLDGTANFLHGHPMHCASVAVLDGGRPVAGAVVSSATGERWWGARGQGAYLDGTRVRVSDTREIRWALVATGFPFKNLPLLPTYLGQMDRVLRGSAGIRRMGSAAMDLCYLACGRVDGFWELDLGPWDVAAGVVILEEAGGIITDLEGAPLDLSALNGFLAANNPFVHGTLGSLVRGDSSAD